MVAQERTGVNGIKCEELTVNSVALLTSTNGVQKYHHET